MATFKDIAKANERIQTVDIKGKAYAPVNERVKAFRELYPEGYIKTELISDDGTVCVIQAAAGFFDEDGNPRLLGSGIAFEDKRSSFVNKTSYIENCETSAIGRCLGSIGLGVDASFASANEMENALKQQEEDEKKKQKKDESKKKDTSAGSDPDGKECPEDVKEYIRQMLGELGLELKTVTKNLGVKIYKGEDGKATFTAGDGLKIMRHLEEKLAEINDAVEMK